MLMHSFVLDALDTTAADTFSHFEVLIDEHRSSENRNLVGSGEHDRFLSRLKRLVPTVGVFHTRLLLRDAFIMYNKKYALTKRRHICISFNELRHILNLAQILAFRDEDVDGNSESDEENLETFSSSAEFLFKLDDNFEERPFNGPKMITFDGDQTLYSDGANFESNPKLANYMYMLLRCGVIIAVVTAAGYEYQTEKYELRLSGLLAYFKQMALPAEDCERFYLFGGECNYLLALGHDYKLYPVKENGAGGWFTSTKHIQHSPANWDDTKIQSLLDEAETSINGSLKDLKIPGRIIRKKCSIGLIPKKNNEIRREALDETVLRAQSILEMQNNVTPYCAFNGGKDVWVDVGNKRVGVEILSAYLGKPIQETLHIGDQFTNTGNDVAARSVCPCIWITSPEETTYILKTILRLAGIHMEELKEDNDEYLSPNSKNSNTTTEKEVDMKEITRRHAQQQSMDVYTGEIICQK